MILFSYIIPIGLRVNLDLGKIVYSWFIQKDETIPGTVVRYVVIFLFKYVVVIQSAIQKFLLVVAFLFFLIYRPRATLLHFLHYYHCLIAAC